MIKKIQNRYIRHQINLLKNNKFDKIIIIRGYAYDYEQINYIKNKYKNAFMVMYQWDPMSISMFDSKAIPLFDKCYSFDKTDCIKFVSFEYLPLFYKKDSGTNLNVLYDFSFVGAVHSNRLEVLSKLIPQLDAKGYNYRIIVTTNKLKYYLGRLKKYPGYREFPKDMILFTPLPRLEVQKIFQQSRVIIDINHPLQSGLSIRVIEVLSKRKRLLTTNKSIEEDVFYDPLVIGIIKNNELPLNIEELVTSNSFVDISILEVNNWVKKVADI